MVKLEVSRKDRENMVLGTTPDYSVFDHPLIKQCGQYTGGFHDKWNWSKDEIKKLSDQKLLELYTVATWRKQDALMSSGQIEKNAEEFAKKVVFNLELSHGKHSVISGKPDSYFDIIKVAYWKGQEDMAKSIRDGKAFVSAPTTALKIVKH